MKKLKRLRTLLNNKGEMYIDTTILVMVVFLILAIVVKVTPVFIVKNQLDTMANEIVRDAEIQGRIGSAMDTSTFKVIEKVGLIPDTISWEGDVLPGTTKVKLDGEISLILTYQVDIGLFDSFGSFPITLKGKAVGKSEVYWK